MCDTNSQRVLVKEYIIFVIGKVNSDLGSNAPDIDRLVRIIFTETKSHSSQFLYSIEENTDVQKGETLPEDNIAVFYYYTELPS